MAEAVPSEDPIDVSVGKELGVVFVSSALGVGVVVVGAPPSCSVGTSDVISG